MARFDTIATVLSLLTLGLAVQAALAPAPAASSTATTTTTTTTPAGATSSRASSSSSSSNSSSAAPGPTTPVPLFVPLYQDQSLTASYLTTTGNSSKPSTVWELVGGEQTATLVEGSQGAVLQGLFTVGVPATATVSCDYRSMGAQATCVVNAGGSSAAEVLTLSDSALRATPLVTAYPSGYTTSSGSSSIMSSSSGTGTSASSSSTSAPSSGSTSSTASPSQSSTSTDAAVLLQSGFLMPVVVALGAALLTFA